MDKHDLQAIEGNLVVYLKIAGVALLSILTLFVLVETVNAIKTYPTIGTDPATDLSRTITVSGHGEVDAVLDLGTFSWTVNATAKDIAGSQAEAAAKSNAAIAYLKSQGVADADISNQNYSTNEQYQSKSIPCTYSATDASGVSAGSVNGAYAGSAMAPTSMLAPSPAIIVCPPTYNSEVVGYTTTQTVTVKIHNVKEGDTRIGTLISGVGKQGVQPSDVSFSFENPDLLKANARSLAIANARSDAERLARDLGVTLGNVVGYNDNNYGGGVMYSKAMATPSANAAPVPQIPVGQSTVTSDVTVTYTIK